MKQIQNAAVSHTSKETEKQDDRRNLSIGEHEPSGELALGRSPINTSELEYHGTGRELLNSYETEIGRFLQKTLLSRYLPDANHSFYQAICIGNCVSLHSPIRRGCNHYKLWESAFSK